jgi:hypothetical protein
MTSPLFRRRGVLTRLGTEAYRAWAEAGVAAVLGLPNEQWGSRTGALGWRSLFPLAWLRIPLRVERLLTGHGSAPRGASRLACTLAHPLSLALYRARRVRLLGRAASARIQVEALSSDCPALDDLWLATAPFFENMQVRDATWLKWRYMEAVGMEYRLLLARRVGEPAGYIAYRVVRQGSRSTGYIADLFTRPGEGDAASALLAAAFDDMWATRAATARVAAAPGSWLYAFCRWAGFTPLQGRFSFDMVPLDPALDPTTLNSAASWQLSGGDFDVV